MKYYTPLLGIALGLMLLTAAPALAGEPTGKVGPPNPTMFRCVDKDDGREIVLDRLALDKIKEIADNDSSTLDSMCTSTGISDFGFNTYDGGQFKAFLADLEDQCEDEGGVVVPITDTRIEGYVYEFHPDTQNPGSWFPVPSRDVKVVAKGISFEVFWGSEPDGYYYYPNGFGAGPIVINLELPRDAHVINPNVIINSTGLEETWTVFMGFYRGDAEPPDVTLLRTPDGNALPFSTLQDLEILSQCGFKDLPQVAKSILPVIVPPSTVSPTIEMPNVGGILAQPPSVAVVVLAAALAVALPAVGLLRLRRRKKESSSVRKLI
jgi:hypothetical protein